VQPKGFKGEEYTVADSKAMAYQDIGEIMDLANFKGLKRDGNVPDGSRIFRRPFFNPKGEMTVAQWYTAKNDVVDYRIGPRETKIEHFKLELPKDVAKGQATVTARLLYSQIPSSVGEFFKLSKEEYAPILVNEARVMVNVK
jgi:hypothetical protein